ncbi:MAG: ribonuclease HI family protein [Coriobacteriia bacterium]|nr:ribonuclease HI family protein [Coriobacteriia bacterium]
MYSGSAGSGFVLLRDDEEVCTAGAYLGQATNYVAEYSALIWVLENALALGVTEIDVYTDSDLIVKQVTGEYGVKAAGLKPLQVAAAELCRGFERCMLIQIPREENIRRATQLAKEAVGVQAQVGICEVSPEDIPALMPIFLFGELG